jgi:hydrogenase maturation protease
MGRVIVDGYSIFNKNKRGMKYAIAERQEGLRIKQPANGSRSRLPEPGRPNRRILVAGIGNVLRGDDGFGPAVVRAFEQKNELPNAVKTVELGIGGINLVLELLDGYDALLLVDAVDRGGEPGSLYILEPQVPHLAHLSQTERGHFTVDMHETVPGTAFIIAKAIGALPPFVRMIGCQPGETEEFSMELTPAVREAVPQAVQAISSILAELDETHE